MANLSQQSELSTNETMNVMQQQAFLPTQVKQLVENIFRLARVNSPHLTDEEFEVKFSQFFKDWIRYQWPYHQTYSSNIQPYQQAQFIGPTGIRTVSQPYQPRISFNYQHPLSATHDQRRFPAMTRQVNNQFPTHLAETKLYTQRNAADQQSSSLQHVFPPIDTHQFSRSLERERRQSQDNSSDRISIVSPGRQLDRYAPLTQSTHVRHSIIIHPTHQRNNTEITNSPQRKYLNVTLRQTEGTPKFKSP